MRRIALTRLYYVLALLLGAAWGTLPVESLDFAGNDVVMSGFRLRENREDGTVSWELSGAKAAVVGGVVRMTDVELVLHLEDGARAVITSPGCRFNRETNVVRSDQTIRVRHPGFDLDGKGYHVEADRQRLHIQHDVKMVIRTPAGVREPGGDGRPGVAPSPVKYKDGEP